VTWRKGGREEEGKEGRREENEIAGSEGNDRAGQVGRAVQLQAPEGTFCQMRLEEQIPF
jgi:hypothetical protein